MNFLKNNRRISFRYEGVDFSNLKKEILIVKEDGATITDYLFPDGFKVTNIAKKYDKYGAYEWVTWFENTGKNDTGVISELCDCDVDFAFEQDERPKSDDFLPQPLTTKIYSPAGSTWAWDEFCANAEETLPGGTKAYYLFPGDTKTYATSGGCSSQERAPFFDINRLQKGVIFAIGWTGQWNCRISRNDTQINVKTGIENVRFRLHPKERIRTSSIVILPYGNGQTQAHNQWRRLVKEHFSLLGTRGRPKEGPFCTSFWGSTSSEKLVRRINEIGKSNFGYEYIWIDADWYGASAQPYPDETRSSWFERAGDWRVDTVHHPDGLEDIAAAVKRNGMKFILWFEPERARTSVPAVREHPEYFLHRKDHEKDAGNVLLNLGNEKAWRYCFDTLCEKIEKLGIDCYRQDFNFDPLEYWRENDEGDRQGIHEIKHIMGMYRLWDTLLEKYPHLLIDNCASGGRRIDIETLRRSVPLWRSDSMCPANCEVETTQTHTQGFNMWIPYSGTGSGRIVNDTYRLRSSYAAAMVSNYWYSDAENFEIYDEDTMNWIRKTNAEYLKVREYFSCDFYPLTEISVDEGSWCACQFDRPDQGDGVVLIFKRPKSLGITYQFRLGGISGDKTYRFTDADTNENFDLSGKEIQEHGFSQTIYQPRTAKLYFYHAR